MGKLGGKIGLVTGGTSGIGFATARRFADKGAHVFISDQRPGSTVFFRPMIPGCPKLDAADRQDPWS